MVLPITEQAGQQIRTPQYRAVCRRGAANHDMVAPARPDMASIHHELFRTETGSARFFVERCGIGNQLIPIARWVEIDLNDSGVRRDFNVIKPMIMRRRLFTR